jgi:isocitrate lyase
MDLQDWDIDDDWIDYERVLAPSGAMRMEAMVAWLIGWHCTNKEVATIISAIPDGRLTGVQTVKRHVERLFVRLRVHNRGGLARRVRRLVGQQRAHDVARGRARVAVDES